MCLADSYGKLNFIAACTRDVLLLSCQIWDQEKLEADKREMEAFLRLRKHVNTVLGECQSAGLTCVRSRPSRCAIEIIM
jgi:hypothetical protein